MRVVLKIAGAGTEGELVDVRQVRVNGEVLSCIPERILRRYTVFPLEADEQTVRVVAAPPVNLFMVDDLQLVTGKKVRVAFAEKSEIQKLLDKYLSDPAVAAEEAAEEAAAGSAEISEEALLRGEEAAPIIRLVNSFFRQGLADGASDIHVEPRAENTLVRFRVDGVMLDKMQLAKRIHPMVAARIKILAGLDIAQRRLPQDGRVKINLEGRTVNMRISTLPTVHGEKVVIRFLSREGGLLELEQLGLAPPDLHRMYRVLRNNYGMLLITGPTGSGKTTTLYSLLNRLKTSEKNVITLEDPVEYEMEGVNQVAINPKAGLTFAGGLRAVLRQDPDIIMVGEIRDRETADIAVRAALTGHLVLSTLHTNDAASTVTRLLDMGLEAYLVAPALIGVVAQRLLRRICPHCRVPYVPAPAERKFLEGLPPVLTAYRGAGCGACEGTGYRGRIGVFEVMVLNDRLREMIVGGAGLAEIKKEARRGGMSTLLESARQLVAAGVVSFEEVGRVLAGEEESELFAGELKTIPAGGRSRGGDPVDRRNTLS
ncbi:MAG: GspE/PulE family protein [Armatimonadetes bacterium]|nr:GspE/PulE family protein [Armatimonadota bacterium]